MENLVSIITPMYNSENFIKNTIESVLNQTYKNWEMIIVDDCSKDNGIKIVEKYVNKDKRIKLYKNKINLGGAETRNIAIKEAKGKYIAFLDSDDIWKETKLEKQLNFMIKNNYDFTYTKYERVSEEGKKLNLLSKIPPKVGYTELLKRDSIGCLTAMYNCKNIGKVYIPNIKIGQDYALWLEILKKVDYAYGLEENLAEYRVRKNSLSKGKIKKIKYIYKMYRDYNKQNLIKTIFYIAQNIIDSYFNLKMEKIRS